MGATRVEQLRDLAIANTPAVANYLRHRLHPLTNADLDDLLEEVLIVTWKRFDDIPVGDELPWLMGVARHVLSNAKRSRNRRSKMESSLRGLDAQASAEMWVLASAAIREAMESLSAADRDILMLHHWEGIDAHGIAVVYSISGKAAESRLSRARMRVRRAFEAPARNGSKPVSGTLARVEE